MKKTIYAILVCTIIAGAIIISILGLKADITYSENVQIDIYLGKTFEIKDLKQIVNEVFPNERNIIKKVELFGDMVTIFLPEQSDEELKEEVELLNTKINEKYQIENKVENIVISHNPEIKLSNILKPYISPIIISLILILLFVAIRYRALGIWKIILNYMLVIGSVEAVYFGIISITRFPVNRLVIPISLALYVISLTVLGIGNEKKLEKISLEDKK